MGFLSFLGTPLGFIMYAIESVVNNFGLSLILFVLVTKFACYPLSIKQQKSTAKMALFQPKLKALEKKYGKDKQKYQSEMMKLYEQEGINPAGGCLPMAIQMILLFGIIDVIYYPLKHLLRIPADLIKQATDVIGISSGSEIKIISQIQAGASNLDTIFGPEWVEKIKNFDMNFLGLNLGDVPTLGFNWLILIPILSGVTALLTTLVSMKQQAKNGQQMKGAMKYVMYFMPLMSLWIAFSVPAGVGLYWIISNVFNFGQTIVLAKIYTPEKLANSIDKGSEKTREKMRKKREKMEAYNQVMEKRGVSSPKPQAEITSGGDGENQAEIINAKEIAKRRLAEARRKAAEKYGDDYKDE